MQIAVYFLIVACGLGLLCIYCFSNKSAPLAAIVLLIALVHGLVFKPLLLLFSGYESFVGAYILSGIEPMRFWVGGTYIACGFVFVIMIILVLEYSYKLRFGGVGFEYYKKPRRIFFDTLVCSGFLGLALIALISFLISNPELIYLGGKNSLASTDIENYSGSGFTRLIINFANIVVFLMIHNIAVGVRAKRSKHIAIVSALIYLVYAVLSDQRALILFCILSWGLFIFFCGIRVSRKKLVLSTMAPILLVIFTTFRRVSSGVATNLDNVFAVFANFAGQNFIDITKTISIFDSQYELRYGSTFLDSILIFIPRSLFPEKQTVNIDTLIASEVFGNDIIGSGAVPPGLIGEMMFNFGLIGIPLGLVLSGLLIWLIDFYRYRGRSFYLMFYVMSLYMIGVGILGSSLQSTFVGFLMAGLPLFVLHKISLRRLFKTL